MKALLDFLNGCINSNVLLVRYKNRGPGHTLSALQACLQFTLSLPSGHHSEELYFNSDQRGSCAVAANTPAMDYMELLRLLVVRKLECQYLVRRRCFHHARRHNSRCPPGRFLCEFTLGCHHCSQRTSRFAISHRIPCSLPIEFRNLWSILRRHLAQHTGNRLGWCSTVS